jgi:4-hydroxy-3-polyprenylbenzoate decarboxylase
MTAGARKIVVGVGGASGSIYAHRLLMELARIGERAGNLQVGVVFSSSGRQVWKHELGVEPELPFRVWDNRDFHAPFASGSAGWDAMAVVPCSTAGLGRIAHGVADDLLGRAADVMLKERRTLVLVVRETPLSAIHLENMLTATRAGAVVLPASPSFYSQPRSIDDLVGSVVGRVLDHLGLANDVMPRWGGAPS